MSNKFNPQENFQTKLVSITRPISVDFGLLNIGDMIEVWIWERNMDFYKVDSEGNIITYVDQDGDACSSTVFFRDFSKFRGLIVRKILPVSDYSFPCVEILEPELGILRVAITRQKDCFYTVYKVTKEDYEEDNE